MKSLTFFVYIFLITPNLCQESCDQENYFLCGSGECIKKEFLCDGSKECVDGSDETQNLCRHRSCSQSFDYVDRNITDIFAIPSLPGSTGFRCFYGACISSHFICDGVKHCIADGSDETEELCGKQECTRKEFQCSYGACISRSRACDNRIHCADGSDETEAACKWRKRSCPRSVMFRCKYGACLRKSFKCNKYIDCLDGSDESEETCGPRPGIEIKSSIRSRVFPRFGIVTPPPNTPVTPRKRTTSMILFPGHINTPKPTVVEEGSCNAALRGNDKLQLISCGGNDNCDGDQLPEGATVLVTCGKSKSPLRCQGGAWHSLRDPNSSPRKTLCMDTTTPNETPIETKVQSPTPSDCGNLPMFSPVPWLVGLFRNGNYACSGTVVGPSLILTAAHCVIKHQATSDTVISPKSIKVQYHSRIPLTPENYASVKAIRLHPNFMAGQRLRSDIALLFLEENLENSYGLSSACLDTEGKLLGIQAWTFNRTVGRTSYAWDYFRQTMNLDCVNKGTLCSRHLNLGVNQFCGVNRDESRYLHEGSSGGPYFIVRSSNSKEKWTVAGVLSNTISTSDCGLPHSVFTSVSKLHSWIVNCGFKGEC